MKISYSSLSVFSFLRLKKIKLALPRRLYDLQCKRTLILQEQLVTRLDTLLDSHFTCSRRLNSVLLSITCSIGLLTSSLSSLPSFAATPDSVLPKHERHANVKRPEVSLGFEIGQWHARPEQLVSYYQQLAKESPRVKLEVVGYTHEQRPILNLIITSEKNQARLAHIRQARQSASPDTPVVVMLGYSVHGNESSGANAAPLVAWHLASSQDAQVQAMLEQTVVVIDPMLNPDGLARFASWANSYRGKTLVADSQTQEHREAWPSGRGNHYWFDLNRDWLWLQHPESQAHVQTFQTWRPHIFCDFHEQGTDATYFFQPGVPTRTHPMTPAANQKLTEAIAKFHRQVLDARGEWYFSREQFDDFYYGKGSTYPDVQGSIGILFEQASSRGHIQNSISAANGVLKFDHTIANQISTSLSTLEAAYAMREQLHQYQKQFFADTEKMYKGGFQVFAIQDNPARLHALAHLFQQHGIAIHHAKKGMTIENKLYEKEDILIAPLHQRQARLLESITELRTQFQDNAFYDVSAFSVTKAYNLATTQTQEAGLMGDAYTAPKPFHLQQASSIGYAFDWKNDDAVRMLAKLTQSGVKVRTITVPLRVQTAQGEKNLSIGSIVVPYAFQNTAAFPTPQALFEHIKKISATLTSEVWSLNSGAGLAGIDLGSASLKPIDNPRILLVIGAGVDSTSAGELWYWLDSYLQFPVTQVTTERLATINLEKYTHVILPNGSYRFSEEQNKTVERFVKNGGVLIGLEGALKWASTQNYIGTQSAKSKKGDDSKKLPDNKNAINTIPSSTPSNTTDRLAYKNKDDDAAKKLVAGVIMEVKVDTSHPLGAGLERDIAPVFLTHADTYQLENDAYGTVAAYTTSPLVSGFASPDNVKKISNTAAITAQRVGSGSVILTSVPLGFRGGWIGSRRLLENAIFFGKAFEKARTENSEDD